MTRKIYPFPELIDGRRARITSHHTHHPNPDRDKHWGADIFYPARADDPWPRSEGTGRWVVPPGTPVLATEDGTIGIAGRGKTGWRCWVHHSDGYRTGYFHLSDLRVKTGQRVRAGEILGLAGDNPADKGDKRHLHFERSVINLYNPIDPAPYLATCEHVALTAIEPALELELPRAWVLWARRAAELGENILRKFGGAR